VHGDGDGGNPAEKSAESTGNLRGVFGKHATVWILGRSLLISAFVG